MEFLKKLFPFSLKPTDVKSLVITIVIYVVVSTVIGWIASLLSGIILVGLLASLLSWVLGLYCTGGIVVAILAYCKVIK